MNMLHELTQFDGTEDENEGNSTLSIEMNALSIETKGTAVVGHI